MKAYVNFLNQSNLSGVLLIETGIREIPFSLLFLLHKKTVI